MRLWPKRQRSLSLDEWAQQFVTYAGHQYPLFGYGPSYPSEKLEQIAHNFRGYVGGGYMGNAVVFACILSRMQLFSEARFQWRQLRSGYARNLCPQAVKCCPGRSGACPSGSGT